MHFIGLVHFALYIFVKYSLRHDQSETSTSYFILIFHPAGIGSKKRNESSEVDDLTRSTGSSKKTAQTDLA